MRGLVAARAAVLTAVVAIDGDNVVPRVKVARGIDAVSAAELCSLGLICGFGAARHHA
jgi:hypothetical protein